MRASNRRGRAAAGIVLGTVLLAVALAGLAVWLGRSSGATSVARAPAHEISAAPSGDARLSSADATHGSQRAPRESETASAPPAQAELPVDATPLAPTLVSGRVYDPSGVPIGGLGIATHAAPTSVLARSGADGAFQFEWEPRGMLASALSGAVLELGPVRGEGWVAALGLRVTRERCRGLVLVVARPLDLAGLVVDADGLPISGADVVVNVQLEHLNQFPLPLDRNDGTELRARSMEHGRFELRDVPSVPRAELRASRDGYESAQQPLPALTTLDLALVLQRKPEASISGVVLSADRRPVEAAWVQLMEKTTQTGADGRFELQRPAWTSPAAVLAAVLPGYEPALVRDFGAALQRGDPGPQTLVLGPPTLEIRGRVLLANGDPAPKWTVVLEDAVILTPGRVPFTTAEGLAAGGPGHQTVRTAPDGAFVLAGLSQRAYALRAFDSRSLLQVVASDVRAGTVDLVLRVPQDAVWAELAGTVSSADGQPLPDVHVVPQLVTAWNEGAQQTTHGKGTLTDARGQFVLRDVPRVYVRLAVGSEQTISSTVDVPEVLPSGGLAITLERRCHFRYLCERTSQRPNSMRVLDGAGVALDVYTFQSNGWSSSDPQWLGEQASTHAYAVSERGRTLVLYGDVQELARLPLDLVPGQVVEVRY